MTDSTDVVVIGAGVIGCAAAYFLAQEGLQVTIMEREAVGSGATAHGHGALTLVGKDFNEGPHFLLGLAAKNMYPQFAEELMAKSGIDPMLHEKPGLSLALNEEEEGIFKAALDWQRHYVDMKWIDGDEVRRLEPRISTSAIGAVLYEHGQVDGYRLSLAMTKAIENAGGNLLLREAIGLTKDGDRVTGVRYPGGEIKCQTVVIAAGAWAHAVEDWLDFPIPIRPLKGEVLRVILDDDPVEVFIVTARHGPILPRRDGSLLVGSIGGVSMSGTDVDRDHFFDPKTKEFSSFDMLPTEAGRNHMLNSVLSIMPAMENAQVVEHLAGVRPLCADRRPIIGAVPGWHGVYVAGGHGTKGIHLAPITGKIIADLVMRGKSHVPAPLEAFSPVRFAR